MLMKGQNLVTLSEEQLVDCDSEAITASYWTANTINSLIDLTFLCIPCHKESNKGCGGGLFTDTWTYIKNAGGIQSDSDYPYTAGKDGVGSCKFKKSNVVTTVIGSVKVPNNNRQIMAKLRSIGPVWMNYSEKWNYDDALTETFFVKWILSVAVNIYVCFRRSFPIQRGDLWMLQYKNKPCSSDCWVRLSSLYLMFVKYEKIYTSVVQ